MVTVKGEVCCDHCYIELGTREPLRRLAVLHPLYRSTIRSFMSSADPTLPRGGLSIANGKEDTAALSKKNAFVPLTYIAEDCEPVRNRNNEAVVYSCMLYVAPHQSMKGLFL